MNKDGEPDCDPAHPKSTIVALPEEETVDCKHCAKGMSRDEDGNCAICSKDLFQPRDLDDAEPGAVECEKCGPGNLAVRILDLSLIHI